MACVEPVATTRLLDYPNFHIKGFRTEGLLGQHTLGYARENTDGDIDNLDLNRLKSNSNSYLL